jgi:Ca2+-dependent lipid-binding protein
VEDLETQRLTIQLFDYDRIKPHDFLGVGDFPLSELKPDDAPADIWIDLRKDARNKELKPEGKVHLRLLYTNLAEGRTETTD